MKPTTKRYSSEEMARRGDELVKRIEATLPPEAKGTFLAVEVDGGEYELDADDDVATRRLHDRVDGAQVWLARVGYSYTRRLTFWPKAFKEPE